MVAYSAAVSQPVAVLVGALELVDRLRRPFLERQRAIAVRRRAWRRPCAAAPSISSASILPSLFLSARREALLLAALGARFGRFERLSAPNSDGAGRARGRRGGQSRALLRARLPQQECAGQEQKAGRGPGEETRHRAPPSQRRFGAAHAPTRSGFCQLSWKSSRQAMRDSAAPTRPTPASPGRRSSRPRARPAPSAAAAARGSLSRQLRHRARAPGEQECARVRIAAVARAVDQRPQRARRFRISRRRRRAAARQCRTTVRPRSRSPSAALRPTETARATAASHPPARDSSLPGDAARQQLACDRLQPRLGRRRHRRVELLQPLAPPGEPDRAERRLACVVATTSASARSRSHSAAKAGRTLGRQLRRARSAGRSRAAAQR